MKRSELRSALTPEAIKATIDAQPDDVVTVEHHDHSMGSERTVTYKGHEIVVRTTYAITVDGQPFEAAINVDNGGRVHYHGLPTRDFSSVIALVKKAIDVFPSDFADHPDHPPADHGHMHDHGPM